MKTGIFSARWVNCSARFAACLAIILLFGLAAVPAEAKSRAAQKRSTGEIRSLATAILSYAVDYEFYPDTQGKAIPYQDIDKLPSCKSKIAPDYLRSYILQDGWGKNPYYYASNGKHFVIYCLGSDGKAGKELEEILKALFSDKPQEYKPTSCYQDDIIWGDDAFIRAPEGPQKKCK